MSAPAVQIVEVGPRDGLQDLSLVVPTAEKLELIGTLIDAGLRRIEVTSFAHPTRVPQMADAEAVIAGLGEVDCDLIGLVLNERGLRRALACGVRSVNTVVLVTDTFSMQNQAMTTREALDMSRTVTAAAVGESMRCGVTLSAAFGCPYEGAVAPQRVVDLAMALADAGADELSLADTIGVGTPGQVEDLVGTVRERVDLPIRVHLHDRGAGEGVANAAAAIRAGASFIDASAGGLGGCPFAPESAGNVSTEAIVALLDELGVDTGIDAGMLATASRLARGFEERSHAADGNR